MILVDTSIILDIVKADQNWAAWSRGAFEAAAIRDTVAINDVIFAELCARYDALADVEAMLDVLVLEVRPLPRAALFQASKAFGTYRQRGGIKTGVLPDFFIGAHAAVEGASLLTRDPGHVRSYFPTVTLISP